MRLHRSAVRLARVFAVALTLAALPATAHARQAAPPTIDWMSRLAPGSLPTTVERPFGTLREQAAMQQAWLKQRLDTFLPALMRKYGIDLWVVPMREYNEDPVFGAIVAPPPMKAPAPMRQLPHSTQPGPRLAKSPICAS